MMIIGGVCVYESKVAMKFAMEPMVGGVFSGVFMLIVKSALFDCCASSETASSTESEVAEITFPGTLVVKPFMVSQTLPASSVVPLARTNSLSVSAMVFRSGVDVTALCANSCGDGGGGAGVMVKPAGGFRDAFAWAWT